MRIAGQRISGRPELSTEARCAPPLPVRAAEQRRAVGGSRRALSEAPKGPSCAAARQVEQRRELVRQVHRRTSGEPGSPSFGYFSWRARKVTRLPGETGTAGPKQSPSEEIRCRTPISTFPLRGGRRQTVSAPSGSRTTLSPPARLAPGQCRQRRAPAQQVRMHARLCCLGIAGLDGLHDRAVLGERFVHPPFAR
jgi:hypothetical protein